MTWLERICEEEAVPDFLLSRTSNTMTAARRSRLAGFLISAERLYYPRLWQFG